jgi:DNA-binding response OmpR family regulator
MKKILIIEDDKPIRDIISMYLQMEGYLVIEAENGAQGFDFARLNVPDLIISDIMMPVMDGFDTLQKIRNTPETSHIPFIILTALETRAAKRLGEELGANEFIVKPFRPKELLETIRNKLAIQHKTNNQTINKNNS